MSFLETEGAVDVLDEVVTARSPCRGTIASVAIQTVPVTKKPNVLAQDFTTIAQTPRITSMVAATISKAETTPITPAM